MFMHYMTQDIMYWCSCVLRQPKYAVEMVDDVHPDADAGRSDQHWTPLNSQLVFLRGELEYLHQLE